MKIALSLSAVLLGVVLAGCGPTTKTCTPANCSTGCCDSSGTCQPGSSANACGQLGSTCSICNPGQTCSFGICSSPNTGGGSGGGTGGGTGGGAMGGGGGSTGGGGGSVTGGGGGSVTGGGGGSVTGGGGGSVTGGGGGSVTGGGGGGSVTGGGGGSVTGGGGGSSNAESCTTARALISGQAVTGQNLTNFISDYDGSGTGCLGSTASDAAFSIVVPPGQLASVTVTPDATLDATVSASTSAAECSTTCVAGADLGVEAEAEVLTWKNTTGAAQTLFIVVDGFDPSSTGTFGILATLSTPPADDVCSAPVVLTPGVTRTAQTFAEYADDYSTTSSCVGYDADRVFSIAVGNGQRLTVTATPSANANVALNLVDGAANCGVTCVATANAGSRGVAETLGLINTSGATRTYLVVADFLGTGTFDIVATVGAAAADEQCGGATLLTSGSTLSGQTTVGYVNDYQSMTGSLGCTVTETAGPDRVYQFTVPNLQRGVVTVTPSGGFNPSINVVESPASTCSAMPRVCAAGANGFGADLTETLSVNNVSGASKTYFAIVDGTAATGTFNIGYATGTPPANDTCASTTLTLTSGTRNDNLTGFVTDYGSGVGCKGFSGPDRVYRVQLAANQKYTVTATPSAPDGGLDPVINFIAGPASNCEAVPRVCRGGADATLRNQGETGTFTNTTGATMDLYVVVSDYETDSTNRDFSLVSSIAAAPAGETCQVPQTITVGSLAGQTTVGASADVTFTSGQTGCVVLAGAPDRVYSVSVPNGQTLTVTATPAADEDLAINVISGTAATCNAVTSCVASADLGFDSDAEIATWTNNTGATRVVFVQVFAYGVGGFSLLTQIQ